MVLNFQIAKAETAEIEIFQESLSEVTEAIRDFEADIKSTPIHKIVPKSLPLIGSKTYQDFICFSQEPDEYDLDERKAFKKISIALEEWLLLRYREFYKDIYPVLKGLALQAKDLPVRLGSISVNVAPLGIGGSVTIDINYDSSMLE